MAYCDKCGAYIPDGQDVCLACGFDPEAEKQRAAQAQAQAAAYAAQAASAAEREAEIRAEVERRRAERQESDRVWAENERRRRQMEEDFQRAQEEKERRAESYVYRDNGKRVSVNVGDLSVDVEKGKRVSVDIGGRRYSFGAEEASGKVSDESPVRSTAEPSGEASGETRNLGAELRRASARSVNKGLAAISYMGVLVFVPMLLDQEDEFVQFHAKQGIKLLAYTLLGSAIGSIFGIGWIATVGGLILSIMGIVNAVSGKKEQLPLLSKLKWF